MVGLWADGWFYLSAAGFLISSVLFVFLLGQYRSAVEAEDGAEEESAAPATAPEAAAREPEASAKKPEKTLIFAPAEPAPVPVSKTSATKPIVPLASAAAEPEAKPVLASLPRSETIPPTAEKKKWSESTSPGGISPAIGYLQHIKEHMDRMEKVVDHVNAMADRQAESNQAILTQLSVIADLMRSQAAAAPAAAPAPVPEPAPVSHPVADPLPDASAPAPAPEPAPEPEHAQPPAALDIQLSSPSGAGESPAQGSEPPKQARKGPVWPI